MNALEFLDKAFRCRWRRLCDAHDRQITEQFIDECGQPFPCAHRAHNPDCNHPTAGGAE